MPRARAIVVPFGVPDQGKGLGLGLASLVHGFVRLEGGSIALAQLHGKPSDKGDLVPVETFVPPPAWSDLAKASGGHPDGIEVVLTGIFEPPTEGVGTLRLLAFDPQSGETRAKIEGSIDERAAGREVVRALDELWSKMGGEVGTLRDLEELDWSVLESVLLAERCAIVDPLRGGPFDPHAALAHMERAVSDAPRSKYPAARLASLALELGSGGGPIGQAALRALVRAGLDAPDRPDLLEAEAALSMRMGDAPRAEARAHAALGIAPKRARIWVIVSEARRSQGNLEGALEAVRTGLALDPGDPVLKTEHGIILAMRGDMLGARHAWATVVDAVGFLPAWLNLGTLATNENDHVLMQKLVDHALVTRDPHPEMLRRAVQLALIAEPEGAARATRIAKLARELLERVENDVAARVVLARALAELGEREAALGEIARVERMAPGSPAAAEAQRGRLLLRAPDAAKRIDALLARAQTASVEELGAVALQSRQLAMQHESWVAAVAEGIAERRSARPAAAREAFLRALDYAPGALLARAELGEVLLALGDAKGALEQGRILRSAGGDNLRTLKLLARARHMLGDREEARALAQRVLAAAPDDPDCLKIVRPEPRSWMRRLLRR
jgi:tetratricopeptide (TPR) repeat protein